MDTTKMWDYRVVRQTENGDDRLSVQEVYYDDETGEPMAHSIDLQLEGDNIADLRTTLQRMLWCLDKDIVSEIKSEVIDNVITTEHEGTDFTPPRNYVEEMMGVTAGNLQFKTTSSDDLPGDHGLEIREMEEYEKTLDGVVKERYDLLQQVLNLQSENSDLKSMLREKGMDIV